MPVNAITMPYLLQRSMQTSSLIEPPGSATYITPLRCALSILSSNGKNASEPKDTPVMVSRYALASYAVSGSGCVVKYFCQIPSAHTSSSFLFM